MYKITSPFFDNLHSYNGMQHVRYTTTIRNIVYSSFAEEDVTNILAGYKTPLDTIQRGIDIVFNVPYPIIDKTYDNDIIGKISTKDLFENAFITKFFTDEIAFESFAEFQMKLYGKLLEVIPIYNMECKLFFENDFKDLWGGYILEENLTNEHNDTNKSNGDNKNTRQNIGNRFPVNNINNVWTDLEKENYATDGGAEKSNGEFSNNHQNDGGYINIHHIDKTNKPDIDKITKFYSALKKYMNNILDEFSYLFIGIL